jgi:hypothetical protein
MRRCDGVLRQADAQGPQLQVINGFRRRRVSSRTRLLLMRGTATQWSGARPLVRAIAFLRVIGWAGFTCRHARSLLALHPKPEAVHHHGRHCVSDTLTIALCSFQVGARPGPASAAAVERQRAILLLRAARVLDRGSTE